MLPLLMAHPLSTSDDACTLLCLLQRRGSSLDTNSLVPLGQLGSLQCLHLVLPTGLTEDMLRRLLSTAKQGNKLTVSLCLGNRLMEQSCSRVHSRVCSERGHLNTPHLKFY
jgi:hypothetical protein